MSNDSHREQEMVWTSSDRVSFRVDREGARRSTFIRDLLDQDKDSASAVNVEIGIGSHALERIAEYLNHFSRETPTKLRHEPIAKSPQELLSPWEYHFVFSLLEEGEFEGNDLLQKVINGANYLNIEDLLDLCGFMVAWMIRDKTAEDIRQMFGVIGDLTTEEEQAIVEQNKWCETEASKFE